MSPTPILAEMGHFEISSLISLIQVQGNTVDDEIMRHHVRAIEKKRSGAKGLYPYAEKFSDFNQQNLLRTTLNEHPIFEKLQQAALTPEQQARLFRMITATFKNAIDVRAPKNRPPGKSGLRAEKGYYRLLYLEGDLLEKVDARKQTNPASPPYNWDSLMDILHQLRDIPELRSEILAGIKIALDEILSPTPAGCIPV